jgi:hypothetical protein
MMRILIFGLLGLSIAAAVSACRVDGESGAGTEDVSIDEFRYVLLPGGARYVTGRIHNPTQRLIRNAQIQVSLFDSDNRRISHMIILVKNVEPGAVKSFREPVEADVDIQGARIRGIMVL